MKVYAVYSSSWGVIEGYFPTRDRAKDYVYNKDTVDGNQYIIEEVEIDFIIREGRSSGK